MSFVQTDRARAVDLRTYLRPLDDAGASFETRDQMLTRSMRDHHARLWADAGGEPDAAELDELLSLGRRGLSGVSGRAQWLGGTRYAYERANCLFNCSACEIATVFDLVDGAWLLLNGCGLGFRPRVGTLHGYQRPIRDLEIVPSHRGRDHRGREHNVETLPCESNGWTWTIGVGDSAAAWAKAGGKMFAPRSIIADRLVLDFSQVRGPGGRLRGYGWICNGYAPLAAAMAAFHGILNDSAGNLLDEIQIMDVMNWWGTVLSSRRAAELCAIDAHNPRAAEFMRSKLRYWDGNPQRRQANHTVFYWSKPSRARIEELLRHMDECGGDPTVGNGEALTNKCPWADLVNPCVPGQTRVLTDAGYARIDSLVGRKVDVWNGSRWSQVEPAVTGHDQPLVRVSLSDGTSLVCTPAHEWVVDDGTHAAPAQTRRHAADLRPGDRLARHDMPLVEAGEPFPLAYTHGFYCGDGFDHADGEHARLYGREVCLSSRLVGEVRGPDATGRAYVRSPDDMPAESAVPHGADVRGRVEWLAGLLDAGGTVVRNPDGVSLQIASVDLPFLLEVRLMLTTLGVQAKIGRPMPGGDREMPDGRGGEALRPRQASHRLVIDAHDVCRLLDAGMVTGRPDIDGRAPDRDAGRSVEVVSVEDAGVAPEVYCFTEPLEHKGTFEGVVTGQCAEIGLPPRGFCNLVSNCLPRFRRDFATLERAIYLIARANYRQTCVDLDDGVLSREWDQTNRSLRLCGVSATGVVQSDWLTDYQIRRMRNAAVAGAYSMADELGLPRPKAVTCLKPEGTWTKTVSGFDVGEVTEGTTRPLGRRIFNWINFSHHDPLVARHEAAGYRVMQNPSDAANVLVCFPIEYRNVAFGVANGREVNLESAVSQLDRYLRWNNLWADHNVSTTVSYSPEEIPDIARWVDENWDRGYVSAAFLRRADPTRSAKDLGHPYLPQDVVTEADFRAYAETLRPVDYAGVHGIYDLESPSCEGGACPAK